MIRSISRVSGIALAALAFASASAVSQPSRAGGNGMLCVHERLISNRGHEVVAQVYLADDVPESQVGQAASILDIAAQSCAKAHGWNPSRTASASDIGLYGATIHYLINQLRSAGVNEPALTAFGDFLDEIQNGEFAAFNEQDWRSDLAFTRRLRGIALDAGLPDEDLVMDMALGALEVGARMDSSVALFELDLANSD